MARLLAPREEPPSPCRPRCFAASRAPARLPHCRPRPLPCRPVQPLSPVSLPLPARPALSPVGRSPARSARSPCWPATPCRPAQLIAVPGFPLHRPSRAQHPLPTRPAPPPQVPRVASGGAEAGKGEENDG
jgi:hypothetical protein